MIHPGEFSIEGGGLCRTVRVRVVESDNLFGTFGVMTDSFYRLNQGWPVDLVIFLALFVCDIFGFDDLMDMGLVFATQPQKNAATLNRLIAQRVFDHFLLCLFGDVQGHCG